MVCVGGGGETNKKRPIYTHIYTQKEMTMLNDTRERHRVAYLESVAFSTRFIEEKLLPHAFGEERLREGLEFGEIPLALAAAIPTLGRRVFSFSGDPDPKKDITIFLLLFSFSYFFRLV